MPDAPPREPRFGFLDAMDREEPKEHPLTNVERGVTLSIDHIANRVVRFLDSERRGLPREEEARIQNSLTRLLYRGDASATRIRRAIIDRVQASGVQRSQEIDALLVGATAVVGVIRNEHVDFGSSRAEHADLQQFIGMSDALDARRKIDLVTIQYEPAPTPIIHEVRFIQVKAGAITAAEQEAVREAHRRYYGEIIPIAETEEQELRSAIVHAARIESTYADALRAHYDDFMTDLLIQPTFPLEENFERLVAANQIPIAHIALLLQHPDAIPVWNTALEGLAANDEERDSFARILADMKTWSDSRVLTVTELRAVLPTWKLDPRYVGVHYFQSVLYAHGTIVQDVTINSPDAPAKTLTVKR